jgi:hypothetical protein
MQHDPTHPTPELGGPPDEVALDRLDDRSTAVEDLAGVRTLPAPDRQHLDVDHGFAQWAHTMLRHHDQQFIRPDGSIDVDAIHARHHRLSPDLDHDHTPAQQAGREAAEQAFDRLNPDFGTPADSRDPVGHRAAQQREAGLALGMRVAVATSRENDPNPVLAIAGQDYRAADAARQASRWPTATAAWAAVPQAEHDWGWQR